ncbi:MAG: YbhB/YbcL family Raf kinase inhibitor-like protein [Pseudolabrys sp.]
MHLGEPGIIGRSMICQIENGPLRKVHPAIQNLSSKPSNDFQKRGYGGPCPPHEHGLHHYHFRLLALSVEQLPVHKNPTCDDVEREARKHTIAEASLVAVYER